MSALTIRPAARDDADWLADLANHFIDGSTVSFEHIPKTPQDMAAAIAARSCFLIAEADTTPLGYASYFPFRGATGYRHTAEHTIQLSPQAQGRGVGRALMAALEDQAGAAGIHILMACVSAENTAGAAFHRAIGFEDCGHLRQVGQKFDRWLDLLLLQKIIETRP